MRTDCKFLDKLSAEGKWDDVFNCLEIDVNSTIELRNLIVPKTDESLDIWLDEHKATTNSLEVILAIILMFDNIFYLALIWYLVLFAFKFIRHRGLDTLRNLRKFSMEEVKAIFFAKPQKKSQQRRHVALAKTAVGKVNTKKT